MKKVSKLIYNLMKVGKKPGLATNMSCHSCTHFLLLLEREKKHVFPFLIVVVHVCSIVTEKKVEKLVGHKLPGQVMKAGPRLLSYSMNDVPTAVGA